MGKKYIVTNFAYGTGPYLRTTELALAFNDEIEKHGKERLGIIVPLIYGDKQKRIMLEEFSNRADEIYLDEHLGKILKEIFYSNNTYEEMLVEWIKNAKSFSHKANQHLSGRFKIVGLRGGERSVCGRDIDLEISRSPRIRYDIAPTYFTTFGYIAEILKEAQSWNKDFFPASRNLLDLGVEVADWVEAGHSIYAVAYPATFSWKKNYIERYSNEFLVPPLVRTYRPNNDYIEPGVFVTTTGIPGLERLYNNVKQLGLNLYSNDNKVVLNSTQALPHIITNKNIIFQFARAGWGSVWLSMISGTPLLVPDFDPKDDWEIYFNNIAVEELGIGIIYKGQKLEEIFGRFKELKKNNKSICDKIFSQWGTLNGNSCCANIFVKNYLAL